MSIQYLRCPIGILRLTAKQGRLTGIVPVCAEGEEERPDAATACAAHQLTEYFSGKRKEFSLELLLQGTPFQCEVWRVLAGVPYGRVVTYGDLANEIGRPTACRAVANAVGKNPFLIVLPCHRVVAANGLGGFSAGLDAKRTLLGLEQVEISEKAAFSEKFFFTFDKIRDTI